jgi:hypothetical protein
LLIFHPIVRGRETIGDSMEYDGRLPYAEITDKRISAFKPRFEKGSSPTLVAEKAFEAAMSANPETRNPVGEDA